MTTKNNPADKPISRELTLTRIFHAPRELVFKAWTDPKHMAQWWGPRGFTNPVCEIDARPGGTIYIVMRGFDMEHPMRGTFREVVKPERLSYTWTAEDHGQPVLEGVTTVTFEDDDGKTRLTLETKATGLAPIAEQMLGGMQEGWSQSLDRLSDLADDTTGRDITAVRIFDAPRDLVFKVWTDPDHVTKWWGPNDFTTTMHEMDVRPGGAWRFTMHGPDGTDYKNENEFLDVIPPGRLVYDHVSPPKHHVIVIFEDEGGKTKLSMRMVFDTAELRNTVAEKFGAVEGMIQHLGRLGKHLESLAGKP